MPGSGFPPGAAWRRLAGGASRPAVVTPVRFHSRKRGPLGFVSHCKRVHGKAGVATGWTTRDSVTSRAAAERRPPAGIAATGRETPNAVAPRRGTRNEGDDATYARRCRRAVPSGEGAMRRQGVRSLARCAGDAGQRPALHCRARFGRVVGTRCRGPRRPRNSQSRHSRTSHPAHHHALPTPIARGSGAPVSDRHRGRRPRNPQRRHSRTSHPAHHHALPTPIARGSGAPVSDRHRGRRPRNPQRRGAPSRDPKRGWRSDVRARSCRRAVPFGEGAMRRKEAREFRPLRGRCRSETGAPLPRAMGAGERCGGAGRRPALRPYRERGSNPHVP